MIFYRPIPYCRAENLTKEVKITVVGKYTKLEDAYASLTRALQHACLELGYKLKLSVSHTYFLNL